jgi:hypothetical protein
VEAWSAFSSDAVDGDDGEFVTQVLSGAAPMAAILAAVRDVESYEYTLAADDFGVYLRLFHASGVALTVPADVSVVLPIGAPFALKYGCHRRGVPSPGPAHPKKGKSSL